jgi:hypothetical protein
MIKKNSPRPSLGMSDLAKALSNDVDEIDLAEALERGVDEMAKIFPAGTPIGDGLRSKNPDERMMMLQQVGKAMLMSNATH